METAQVDTNTRLATLERSIGDVNTFLTAILDRLEKMELNQRDGSGQCNHNSNNTRGSTAGQDEEEYSADTELEEEVSGHRRTEQRRPRNEIGPRPPRQEVRADDS
jgi:hypothetical protein